MSEDKIKLGSLKDVEKGHQTMARQLKRWESPRKEGRNDKGRGGSARQRQKRKQFQALRQKLNDQPTDSNNSNQSNSQNSRKGKQKCLPSFLAILLSNAA